MAWISRIVSKQYTKGILSIGVEFKSSTEVFTESIDATGTTVETLMYKIQNRLTTLDYNDKLLEQFDGIVDKPIDPMPVVVEEPGNPKELPNI